MMADDCYPAIKTLVGFPEWNVWESMLEEKRENLIKSLESSLEPDDPMYAHAIAIKLAFLAEIRRMPDNVIKEAEEKNK